jgi:hypothetical protein
VLQHGTSNCGGSNVTNPHAPTVTQLMRSRPSSHMLALQRMDGSLAYCPKQQAELLTAAFAAASAAPTSLLSAQDELLCCPLCSWTPPVQ